MPKNEKDFAHAVQVCVKDGARDLGYDVGGGALAGGIFGGASGAIAGGGGGAIIWSLNSGRNFNNCMADQGFPEHRNSNRDGCQIL
jgi:hypothetical protein